MEINQFKIKGNRIVIQEPKEADQKSAGGIILTEEKKNSAFMFSTVVAVGDAVVNVKEGDFVMHPARSGILFQVGGRMYGMIGEPEIAAIYEGEQL